VRRRRNIGGGGRLRRRGEEECGQRRDVGVGPAIVMNFWCFFNYLTNDIFLKKKNLIFDVFRITLDIFCFFFDFFIRI
jgi:hypothetical protein